MDADAWLESLDPRILDRWIAFHAVEPFGDEWRQAGQIAAAAHNAGTMTARCHGVDVPAKTADDFIPRVGSGETPWRNPAGHVDPAEATNAMRQVWGKK